METIKINFKGKQVTLVTEGFGGERCKTATEPFERRLGIKKSDELTADYEHQETARVERSN